MHPARKIHLPEARFGRSLALFAHIHGHGALQIERPQAASGGAKVVLPQHVVEAAADVQLGQPPDQLAICTGVAKWPSGVVSPPEAITMYTAFPGTSSRRVCAVVST